MNAIEAKQQTIANIEQTKQYIEIMEYIQLAIKEGKFGCSYDKTIPDNICTVLQNKGYNIIGHCRSTYISWV